MRNLFLLIGGLISLCLPVYAQSGLIPVISTRLQDASGNLISNATVCGQVVTSTATPMSVELGGGGQTTQPPVCSNVSNGAFTLNLPDVSRANPQPCVALTVTDNSTGNTLLSNGYGCVQPTSAAGSTWCSTVNGSTSCNFDVYTPNFTSAAIVETGPRGIQGPPGSNGPLAFTGYFVTAGDSLEDGHGLPGFVSPGYPNAAPAQAWPSILATLPVFQTNVTVKNTNVDGIGLSTMASMYQSAVHPYSPAVTGKPGILCISIYGNDLAVIANEGLAAYETSYASYLSTARADGWKIMFLAQWAQTGRQGVDANRIAFNEYNRQNADYYLDITARMNDPYNTVLYEADGLHANAEGSREIALMAQQVILSGGVTTNFGNSVYENPNNPFSALVDLPAGDAVNVRNTDPAGYSSLLYDDASGNQQFSLGYANPSAQYFAGQAFLNTHSANTPMTFCIVGICHATMNTDGHWSFSANNTLDAITSQSSNNAGYASIAFMDQSANRQLSMGYGNASAAFSPGAAYINSIGTLSVWVGPSPTAPSVLFGTGAAAPPIAFTGNAPNLDTLTITNQSNTGYSSIGYMDLNGTEQGTMGYANPGSNSGFVPGSLYLNTKQSGTTLKLCGNSVCPLTVNTNNSVSLSGTLQGPATAPTGSCTIVGWTFSQDGHATFCNGSTYAAKI